MNEAPVRSRRVAGKRMVRYREDAPVVGIPSFGDEDTFFPGGARG